MHVKTTELPSLRVMTGSGGVIVIRPLGPTERTKKKHFYNLREGRRGRERGGGTERGREKGRMEG